jgi:hypothetical protein
MKLTAIADRGARKDFLDLYAIMKSGLTLKEILAALPKKFPGVNYQKYHFLKALTFFDDAGDEPLKILSIEESWEDIQEYFRREVSSNSIF